MEVLITKVRKFIVAALAVILVAVMVLAAITSAQLSKATPLPPTKPESADPLHRETPRSTLEAFLL
jgi:hypothetical protein